jgi:hypothetical protein
MLAPAVSDLAPAQDAITITQYGSRLPLLVEARTVVDPPSAPVVLRDVNRAHQPYVGSFCADRGCREAAHGRISHPFGADALPELDEDF